MAKTQFDKSVHTVQFFKELEDEYDNNKTKMAEKLGISRTSLNRWIKKANTKTTLSMNKSNITILKNKLLEIQREDPENVEVNNMLFYIFGVGDDTRRNGKFYQIVKDAFNFMEYQNLI